MFKLVLEKAEEPKIKFPAFPGSWRKQGNFGKKKIYHDFIDYAKVFDMWITTNCGKFFKRWEYQTT